jgi:hypothetical protein
MLPVEREPFHSARSLAEIVGVSYATIIRHLQDSLEMKSFHLYWALGELAQDLCNRRLETCRPLLPILEARELDSIRVVVIGDET